MDITVNKKLYTDKELKELLPMDESMIELKKKRDAEIADILSGKSDKIILVIGPCSADREDAVLDYIGRLKKVQEKVEDKIFIIPRIYTNKPRTTGDGYKGMALQPDPEQEADMQKAYSSNPVTDCTYYPESGKYAVINNTFEAQNTIFYDVDGASKALTLQPNEIVWIKA